MRHRLSIHDVSEALLRWRVCESKLNQQQPILIGNYTSIPDGNDIADVIQSAVDDCVARNGDVLLERQMFDGMHRFVLRDTRDLAQRQPLGKHQHYADIIHATSSSGEMAVLLLCVMLDDHADVLTTKPNVPHEG